MYAGQQLNKTAVMCWFGWATVVELIKKLDSHGNKCVMCHKCKTKIHQCTPAALAFVILVYYQVVTDYQCHVLQSSIIPVIF